MHDAHGADAHARLGSAIRSAKVCWGWAWVRDSSSSVVLHQGPFPLHICRSLLLPESPALLHAPTVAVSRQGSSKQAAPAPRTCWLGKSVQRHPPDHRQDETPWEPKGSPTFEARGKRRLANRSGTSNPSRTSGKGPCLCPSPPAGTAPQQGPRHEQSPEEYLVTPGSAVRGSRRATH